MPLLIKNIDLRLKDNYKRYVRLNNILIKPYLLISFFLKARILYCLNLLKIACNNIYPFGKELIS